MTSKSTESKDNKKMTEKEKKAFQDKMNSGGFEVLKKKEKK